MFLLEIIGNIVIFLIPTLVLGLILFLSISPAGFIMAPIIAGFSLVHLSAINQIDLNQPQKVGFFVLITIILEIIAYISYKYWWGKE